MAPRLTKLSAPMPIYQYKKYKITNILNNKQINSISSEQDLVTSGGEIGLYHFQHNKYKISNIRYGTKRYKIQSNKIQNVKSKIS